MSQWLRNRSLEVCISVTSPSKCYSNDGSLYVLGQPSAYFQWILKIGINNGTKS